MPDDLLEIDVFFPLTAAILHAIASFQSIQ